MKHPKLNILFSPDACKMAFADGEPFTQEFRHAIKTHLTSIKGLKGHLEEKYDIQYLIDGDENGTPIYKPAYKDEIIECGRAHKEGVIGIRMATSTLLAVAAQTLLKGA